MPTNLETLTTALATEFGTDISFSASPPSTFTAPSVVVTPSEPFIEIDSHGAVRESWDVLCVASLKDPAAGIKQLRQLSLRVMRTAQAQGAIWLSASSPRMLAQGETNKGLVASVNKIQFKYAPQSELPA